MLENENPLRNRRNLSRLNPAREPSRISQHGFRKVAVSESHTVPNKKADAVRRRSADMPNDRSAALNRGSEAVHGGTQINGLSRIRAK